MNSNRCSRWLVLLVAVSLALSAIPAAAAVDVTEDQSPDDVQVGSSIEDGEAVYTLTDLYSDYDQWVLSGTTDLENPQWTIVWYGQADERLDRQTISNESFQVTVDRNDPDLDAEPTSVEVRVRGDVPEVENYTYDPQASFTVATLSESPDGSSPEEIASDNATHHTEDSRAARTAIEDAQAAIDEADSAGANTDDAEDVLGNAISAYDAGNFDNAEDLAGNARSEAEDAQSQRESSEQTSTLLLYGGIGIVVLLVLGGGLYWYRQQSGDDYGKLS